MSVAALAVALFWLMLALPGYALLRRYARPWLEGGPLAGYALSCLVSFGLLTPVSVAGYALRWPLWVLTASVGLAVIVAALHLARTARWRAPRSRPSLVAVVAGSIVVADAFMGLFAGSYLYGDGVHHTGRVRMLLEHGFNNLDPMIEGQFDPIYHSNLYHALIAASGELVNLPPAHAWAYALFWAKLATAGGIYYLAWTVLRERALAWTAAATFAVYMAPLTVRVYPNSLCIYCFVPLALAFAVQALIGEDRWRAAAGLGAAALVTAQVHGLYYLFICLLIGPALLVALVRTRAQRLPGGRELAAALLALLLGLPWVATTVAQRAVSRSEPPPAAPAAIADQRAELGAGEGMAVGMASDDDDGERAPTFLRLPSGHIMLNPSRLWSPHTEEPQLLLALGLGFFTRRRRALLAIGGPLLVLLLTLYVPPLCTALADVAGAPWILRRLSVAFHAFWFAIVPGTLLLWISERCATRWLQPVALALGVAYGLAQGVDDKPWTRARYLASAIDRGLLRDLQRHAARRALFARAIPRGATVLSPLSDSPLLTMDCDCYPLAITRDRGNRGVSNMAVRRAAAEYLLWRGPVPDLHSRLQALRRYNVTALWLRGGEGRKLAKIYRPIVAREHTSGRNIVLLLDLNRALPPPAGG